MNTNYKVKGGFMRDLLILLFGALLFSMAVKFVEPTHASEVTSEVNIEHRVQRLENEMAHIKHVAQEHGIHL